MRKVLSWVLMALVMSVTLLSNPATVLAADAVAGAKIFSANCAACHIGGGNVVNAVKTLKKTDLTKYGMDSSDSIITQVTNGKNAMPAFKSKLSGADIENVAAYVLSKAEDGWKR